MTDRVYTFGTFELFPDRAMLLKDGARVALGSRALAVLTLLVERAGELVSPQEIVERVWPGVFVEESNLRVQIASLRKALGEGRSGALYLFNEPGRGYRFLVPVTAPTRPQEKERVGANTVELAPVDPPLLVGQLVGREAAIASILTIIPGRRLVTLTGPGGIGKTSLALAVLERLRKDYPGKICFVDLTTLTDPSRVSSALANALQLPVAGEPLPALLRFLHDRRMLVVLDNCEHVVVEAAVLAAALLTRCADLSILTTSREPLRLPGEVAYKVEPLSVPPAGRSLSPIEMMAFSAVELFTERAAAADHFIVTEESAGAIATICQQLDGLPLALELAAASVGTLGLNALMSGLDDRLSLLTQGSRTIRRHETLRAMLDWSRDLLTEEQRQVFAGLSAFRSGFSLDGAVGVLETPALGRLDIIQAIQHLSGKSLLVSETVAMDVRYRMLVTTRGYAAEMLSVSDGLPDLLRRHAEYVLESLAMARVEWQTRSFDDWWVQHGHLMEDVRSALAWASSPGADNDIGVKLTIASGPLWLGRSLLGEYLRHIMRALETLKGGGSAGSQEELSLQISLGHILFAVEGASKDEIAAFKRALELAERFGDLSSQITALWALAGASGVMGDFRAALETCKRMVDLASGGDDESMFIAKRMLAHSHSLLGELDDARRIGEELIANDVSQQMTIGNIYRYDRTTVARANLAKVLWIQGFPDQALEMVEEVVSAGLARRNPHSLAYVLSNIACPVALWCGDEGLASRYIKLLSQCAEANALTYMAEWSSRYAAIWSSTFGYGGQQAARPFPKREFDKLAVLDRQFMITVAPSLVDIDSVSRAESGKLDWCTAEILRAHGEQLMVADPRANGSLAEAMFERAIEVAQRQGAQSWELRAASSLARLRAARGDEEQALQSLLPVLDRFTEGFGTFDLKSALALKTRLDANSEILISRK